MLHNQLYPTIFFWEKSSGFCSSGSKAGPPTTGHPSDIILHLFRFGSDYRHAKYADIHESRKLHKSA